MLEHFYSEQVYTYKYLGNYLRKHHTILRVRSNCIKFCRISLK